MSLRTGSFVIAGLSGTAMMTAASAPSPLYPAYQQRWGFSDFTLTVIFAVYVLALLAALLTVGSLSDVAGRRPVVSSALVLLAVGMTLFSVAGGVGDLVVARIVQGLAVGAATGAVAAMLLDTAPGPRSGAVVSSAAPPLGIAIGAVLAGALTEHAPWPRQLVFWVLAATYLALAALVWLVPERRDHEAPTRGAVVRSLRPRISVLPSVRPRFVTLLPAQAATWALAGLYLSLGSSILDAVLHVRSPLRGSLVLGVLFLAGSLGTVASPWLGRWREPASYGALAAGVVLTVVATLTASLPLYVVGSTVSGLGFGATLQLIMGALGDTAPHDRRGEVFAAMYVASYLAFSVPALAAGLLSGPLGLTTTAVAYGVVEVALVAITGALSAARSTHARHPVGRPGPGVTAR